MQVLSEIRVYIGLFSLALRCQQECIDKLDRSIRVNPNAQWASLINNKSGSEDTLGGRVILHSTPNIPASESSLIASVKEKLLVTSKISVLNCC